MEFRQRLFELRRQAGLSQEELAHLLGVTRQAVQKWEAGTSRPDMDNLTALADYFKVSLDYLIRGEKETTPVRETMKVHHDDHRWQYEYRSRRSLFGLPLVHINFGPGFCRAKGIIAIGNLAAGVVALGGLAVGLFSFGGLALGLLLALGCVSVGGLAVGLMVWGGVAVGLLAFGGVSCGWYAVGGVALGSKVAIGGVASAPLAIGAAVDGAQTCITPLERLSERQRSAVKGAIDAACQGAPDWLGRLLYDVAWHTP